MTPKQLRSDVIAYLEKALKIAIEDKEKIQGKINFYLAPINLVNAKDHLSKLKRMKENGFSLLDEVDKLVKQDSIIYEISSIITLQRIKYKNTE